MSCSLIIECCGSVWFSEAFTATVSTTFDDIGVSLFGVDEMNLPMTLFATYPTQSTLVGSEIPEREFAHFGVSASGFSAGPVVNSFEGVMSVCTCQGRLSIRMSGYLRRVSGE